MDGWGRASIRKVNNSPEKKLEKIPSQGYGTIQEDDLVRLMENQGFKVDQAKTFQVDATLSLEWINSGN